MTLLLAMLACGGESPKGAASGAASAPAAPASAAAATPAPAQAPESVGPDGPSDIPAVAIAAIPSDAASVADGEKVFNQRGCGGCHQFGAKLVGPDLVGVTKRRSVPWITRMVSEPEQMTKKDPVAKDLFKTHMVQMTKQGVTAEEFPKLLAFIQSKGG